MTRPPASLLDRTAGYPPAIRATLVRPLAPEDVASHLTALHGDRDIPESRLRALLADPPLTDAFLARLIQSQRFAARLDALDAALDGQAAMTGAEAAAAAAEAMVLLGALGDPERPYLWKLREVAAREGGQGRFPAARARALLALAAAARPAADAPSAALVLARALLEAARGAPGPLAAWSAAVLGGTAAVAGAPVPGDRPEALARLLVRGLGPEAPGPEDRAAWDALPRDAAGALRLSPPRALALDGAPPAWDALRALFDDDAPARLALVRPVLLSPILVAGLRCTGLGGAPRVLSGPDPEDGPSWAAAALEGHPDPRPSVEIARLRAPGPEAPPLPVTARRAAAVPAGDADPATAYAVVLRLDADAPTGRWLNLEACHVLPGHGPAALEAARTLARARPEAARRPVVLAGRHSPPDPGHLTRAVARHWAHAGGYATASAALDHEPATRRFRLDDRRGAHATRLLPAALATLPLGLLAGGDAALHGPIVALFEGVGACAPGPPLPAATRAGIARDLAPERLDDAARAAVMRAGPVTRALVDRMDGARHWPVEDLLARRAAHHAGIEARVAAFSETPAPREAEAILAALAHPDTDPAGLAGATGRFLVALAAEAGILAALPPEAVADALRRARHHPCADAAARALAVTGPEAVGARSELIGPLTDLFAVGLPEAALQSAWAALAEAQLALPEAPGRLLRLAAAGRRHAGPEAMARLARRLPPGAFEDRRLTRHFRHLPDDPDWAMLARAMGPAPTAAIRAARDPRDAFATALAAGDRAAAQAALSALTTLDEGDLASWLDGLRGLSNEVAALGLSVAGLVPPGGGVQRRKLLAVLLHDRAELAALEADGLLSDGSELSAVALQHLGRPEALEARLGGAWPPAPVPLSGGSAAAVFRRAAAATRATLPGHAGIRVSVVVGAYDPDPEMLALSLASLRAQGHGDLEILLVDDASGPEGRAAIDAARAADPEIRLIRMARNSGPYAGRNRALAEATGAFLAIQDADDWSHPDRIAAQLDAFAAEPALQLVTTPHVRIDAGGRVQLEARFAALGDGPMSSLFRRSVFETVGPFARTRSRGDVEMRERIRHGLGDHVLRALPGPPMLCFAAASTLSQRVRAERREALQLWRGHVDRRPPFWGALRDGTGFDAGSIVVPHALRAPAPEEEA